jgi:lipoprotein-releasing system permease protein
MNGITNILFMALKHLRVRLRQSLAAVLAVALGSMILLVTLAMMEGLLEEFKQKLLEASPPVTVEPRPVTGPHLVGPLQKSSGPLLVELRKASAPREQEKIKNYPALSPIIKSIEGVEEAAPRACSPVVLYHGTRSQRSALCGIEPLAEKEVTRLWEWMEQGKINNLSSATGGIILGNMLARQLSAKMGSPLSVVSPGGRRTELRVVGIFASGITKIDESQSFVRLEQGRRLAGLGGGRVSSISVGVTSLDKAAAVAREIQRKSGHEALTWKEANASAIAQFRMQGVITYFLVIFTAIVGGFGILNIMVTIVMEKTKDIAILRSMGYTARQVVSVFFLEAALIGTAGGVLGLVAGYVIAVLIRMVPYESSAASSIQRDQFTMLLEPSFFVVAFSVSLLVSLVSGISPARKAARVDPVEVLRGER